MDNDNLNRMINQRQQAKELSSFTDSLVTKIYVDLGISPEEIATLKGNAPQRSDLTYHVSPEFSGSLTYEKDPKPNRDKNWTQGQFSIHRDKITGVYAILGPNKFYQSISNRYLAEMVCDWLNGSITQADEAKEQFLSSFKEAP
jgi:hypothetical protein